MMICILRSVWNSIKVIFRKLIFMLLVSLLLSSCANPYVIKEFSYILIVEVISGLVIDFVKENIAIADLFDNCKIKEMLSGPESSSSVSFIEFYQQQDGRYNRYDVITLECYKSDSNHECIRKSLNKFRNGGSLESSKSEEMFRNILYSQNKIRKRIKEYDIAYEQCHDEINESPDIDLDDYRQIYDLKLKCMLRKGFAKEMNGLSSQYPELFANYQNSYTVI